MNLFRIIILSIGLFLTSNALSCPLEMTGNHRMGMMGEDCNGKMSMLRHQLVMQNGVAEQYRGKFNPLKNNNDKL